MLDLKDFFHLPEVDELVEQLVADRPGMVIVAGLDPRPAASLAGEEGFLPSGRGTLFGILARRCLAARPRARAVLVAESKDAVRLPPGQRSRLALAAVKPPQGYAEQLALAIAGRPDLLILDQMDAGTARTALEAARDGIHVLSQLDCVFRGADVLRYLADLGVPRESLDAASWVVTVQRLRTLCEACRIPARLDTLQAAGLQERYPGIPIDGPLWRSHPGGCPECESKGTTGEVAVFDFFRADPAAGPLFEQPSLLPMEAYILRLVSLGKIGLDDLLRFDLDQLHRAYRLLAASEQALNAANSQLRQRLVELESANRVMQQRTQSLISLQELGQTLISSLDLDELAGRVCRQVREIGGADRSVLYVLRPDATAEIVAVAGWNPALVHTRLDAMEVFGTEGAGGQDGGQAATPYNGWPPGIPRQHPDVMGASLRAGLRLPLIAQNEVVGLMVVHSTLKAQFAAGEVALLQAFANQAAIAIQRASLVEALRDKIAQLEAAQAELVRKERLERELELAREVQQSLLPQVFPEFPGYRFSAYSQPARRVGGDFYDIFRLDETHFGVVIADVSDKGMPAALYMALTRSLLLAEARRELSPSAVLASVNRLLLEVGEPGMFVTVFYGVVDTATRSLSYTRAGHEEPFLLRDGDLRPLSGRGTLLGLLDLDPTALSEESVELRPGDRLVLYTDGLLDAQAPDGAAYSSERLQAFLAGQAALSPTDICTATFAEIATFQGAADQFDDMAMVVIAVEDEG